MKKITISLIFICSIGTAFAQTSFNVSSHSAVINGNTYEYSIGEMTLVSTEKNANLIVTQGFLQPTSKGSVSSTNPISQGIDNNIDNIKVYPNPTEDILFVETLEAAEATGSYQLFDAAGKIVLSKTLPLKEGMNKWILNVHSLAAGSYYLVVNKPGKNGTSEKFSYKIQKVN